ncbi:U-box domain-containing protein 15 [Senna tora]|uniref:RING-type E3 ubiquitin transferase n=1 Tax=Senna tora TaxID=362788 RepID=A0A834U3C8_9FABA|nr:U-box domain-containing protein 15 [Senna tora]
MALDGGEEGGETLEGGNGFDEAIQREESEAVEEIQRVLESVAQFGEYRRAHRKECHTLARRLKILLPIVEEIRDLGPNIPKEGIAWLNDLKDALLFSKKLLKLCSEGSKIQLALETEAVMINFQAAYQKLSQAFDALPSEQLGISDELKEQLELICVQLRRARRRTDTQDIELAMDMIVVFSKDADRNVDSAIIERLAIKLDLHTMEDLNIETAAVRKLVKERNGKNAESTQQIIDLLNKFRQVAGMEVTNVLDEPDLPRTLEKCASLVIPHEFLCPITLEIMTDPVIIASGQTYERESIEKWFESNRNTCPKSRQPLPHLSVAPNYALKNLILVWCEKNNYKLPQKETSTNEESCLTDPKVEIPSLVENLSSVHLEVQRKAVKKIRMISKENSENRVLVAEHRGILPLVQLLSYPDSKIQEHAVTALLNLSIDEGNKKLISNEGAIPAIIEVLDSGSIEAKENAAAALFSLSMLDENKEIVGLSNGIPPLVELLRSGTIRGKKDALTALFNLSLNHANKSRAISAGIVTPLIQLLRDINLGMIDEVLSIILLLASNPDGRQELGQLSFIETLVEFIKDGTPKNKECAASVLLELGSKNSNLILAALQFGVYDHIIEIKQSGTDRAKRKADAFLQLMAKNEHI